MKAIASCIAPFEDSEEATGTSTQHRRQKEMKPQARRILIINGKGGCGKTTIATNLAATYAKSGEMVALIDHDPQASSTYWGQQRDEHTGDKLPDVNVVAAHERAHMYQTQSYHNRLPIETSRVIIDTHSGSINQDLDVLLKNADVIVVPLLPSSIDIRAGGNFIAELLTHRAFRQRPRPVGVIANRVQPNTATSAKLEHFLGCLDVPAIATFRDSPVYTEAAEHGMGISDMTASRAARKEIGAWRTLVNWLESLPSVGTLPVQAARVVSKQPRPATRHGAGTSNVSTPARA
jgi:chromosome partitioning protein